MARSVISAFQMRGDAAEKIKVLRDRTGEPLSGIVRMAIRKFLESEESKKVKNISMEKIIIGQFRIPADIDKQMRMLEDETGLDKVSLVKQALKWFFENGIVKQVYGDHLN